MTEPVFLRLNDVFEIHSNQITRYGGRNGIPDLKLLKSAIAMPMTGFNEEYFNADIHEMAAAYLFHIVRNHPFIDGNKPTGVVSALVLLILNGIEITVDEESLENMVISVAEGKIDKIAIARYFRKNALTEK